jgi:hypothetical protein
MIELLRFSAFSCIDKNQYLGRFIVRITGIYLKEMHARQRTGAAERIVDRFVA